ncbi:hypothetical protein BCR36DRAFT_579287 [Piromyces finnis]|uniref:Chitin-binding type-1 domain-containing protein n=1 Tax=Piromyces finnis TaxID=1754191 RepID=A0A1Y1VPC3_9FUNG|nr:hypothetical protein BCR36DRAFT_579287 [Piromyces finnis]|eukprot:ORX61267.1 hypothetical protein BCR36DRAFT_579287 [Piromyces finnis]
MRKFSIKQLLKCILFTSIISAISADNNDSYLKNISFNRGKIFSKTDYNVAKFNMIISQENFDILKESANIVYENEDDEPKVNGTIIININNDSGNKMDAQYKIGGQSTRGSKKMNFNVKLDKKKLGRKDLRLRSAMIDPSFLRIKISTDIINRMGLNSISSSFADVFVNNEYMGLYALIDVYKKSWVKEYYNLDKDPSYKIFKCRDENSDLTINNINTCADEDEDNPDSSALQAFVEAINDKKKTLDELTEIMDVDLFIKSWIFEWLVGSVDHMLVNGKNYYLLKYKNVWIPLIYDFDANFGNDINEQFKTLYGNKNPAEVKFDKWYTNRYIVDKLTKGNNEKVFLNHLQDIIDNAFNPDLLFPHIDSLKSWIGSYIKKDRTPNENGELPGRINVQNKKRALPASEFKDYTYEDYEKNSEYTAVGTAEGLKKWIKLRYKFVCHHYNIKCKSEILSYDNTKNNKKSKDGQCGSDHGKCPNGYCCSKYGYCGKTERYCSISKGCQSEFGECSTKKTSETVASTEGKCGSGYGKCSNGYCCSKYGYCGKTERYCSISKGCQSEFGECSTKKTSETVASTEGKCGSDHGKCPNGYCCSKYGYCGKTERYCSISKGCQSEFGECSTKKTSETVASTEGKCGSGYGKCPESYCCSKYGWCGKSPDYCKMDRGCQRKYGLCK